MKLITKVLGAVVIATSSSHAMAQDFNFSGFGSFVGGFTSEEGTGLDAAYKGYESKDIDFGPDSLIGFQVSTQVNDKVTATLQLVARGDEEWNVEADWAYFSYKANDDVQFRVGRLRVPFYLYSDFITVGYAYPWISPPAEAYSLPFDNINGIDVIYNVPLADADLQIQGYFGATDFEVSESTGGPIAGSEGESKNQFGVNFELSYYDLTFRYAYHQANATLDTSGNEGLTTLTKLLDDMGFTDNADRLRYEEDTIQFHELGIMYDDGRFVSSAEATLLSANDEAAMAEQRRYYIMGGVRFMEQYLVHLTYGTNDDNEPDLSSGLPPSLKKLVSVVEDRLTQDSDEWTLGLRWDFADSTAFKVEVTNFQDNKNSNNDVILTRFGIQAIF